MCLGNPKVVGDAVGPMVGTMLSVKEAYNIYNIIGTIEDPVIRSNYDMKISLRRPGATCIVIDSCIGPDIGRVRAIKGGILPGSAIQEWNAPALGDMHIKVTTCESVDDLFDVPYNRVHKYSTAVIDMLSSLLEILQKTGDI